MKKISKRARALLLQINKTDDASKRLVRGLAKPAQELIDKGLASLVRRASGGADICLTRDGISFAEGQDE